MVDLTKRQFSNIFPELIFLLIFLLDSTSLSWSWWEKKTLNQTIVKVEDGLHILIFAFHKVANKGACKGLCLRKRGKKRKKKQKPILEGILFDHWQDQEKKF